MLSTRYFRLAIFSRIRMLRGYYLQLNSSVSVAFL